MRILDHFLPLRDPADGAREREQHCEHRGGEAHRAQRDARVEVDVRVEPLLNEVIIVQRDALELHGDIEQRIVDAELMQHLMTGLLHDLGARIVVLVDPVAEAHQPERIVLILGALDEFGDALDPADLREHLERGLVGAAMRRAP